MTDYDDPRLAAPPGEPDLYQISAASVPLRKSPDVHAERVTEALHGECVHVYAQKGGWAQVRCLRDGYVGWCDAAYILEPALRLTHKVTARSCHAYAKADLKSGANIRLDLGARVSGAEADGDYILCARAGWIHKNALATLDTYSGDPAGAAQLYLHTPYLWGGRSASGIDCTGLTQQAYEACGVKLPRDSDMQYAWSGEAIEGWQEEGALKRSDLVFWKGHVGIMLDSETLLHANAHHMAVTAEPLSEAIERIASLYAQPIGARRIDISKLRGVKPDWL